MRYLQITSRIHQGALTFAKKRKRKEVRELNDSAENSSVIKSAHLVGRQNTYCKTNCNLSTTHILVCTETGTPPTHCG
jgi:hypothetical protein